MKMDTRGMYNFNNPQVAAGYTYGQVITIVDTIEANLIMLSQQIEGAGSQIPLSEVTIKKTTTGSQRISSCGTAHRKAG